MYKLRPDLYEAPPYVVACVERDGSHGGRHDHVLAIETRDPDGGQTRWATAEVIAALRQGERFVVGEAGGSTSLEATACWGCDTLTLSVSPGGTEIAPCA